MLLLPQLFSKRGRAMVVAYILVITLTGPVANTTQNTEILVSSMHCDAVNMRYKMYNLTQKQ